MHFIILFVGGLLYRYRVLQNIKYGIGVGRLLADWALVEGAAVLLGHLVAHLSGHLARSRNF